MSEAGSQVVGDILQPQRSQTGAAVAPHASREVMPGWTGTIDWLVHASLLVWPCSLPLRFDSAPPQVLDISTAAVDGREQRVGASITLGGVPTREALRIT
jgi:hypothetical protein